MPDDAEPISSPSSPTSPIFHRHRPDALKPNPHPYPIKTTSTGILSRSNSTTKSTAPYQYYVPQSPGSAKDHHQAQNGGMERRGGRHKYSKSLTSESIPSPLPVPPATGAESGHRARSDTSWSLPSDTTVFAGEVENDDIAGPGLSKKPRRATVSALEASIAGSGGDVNDGEGAGGRKRTYRTIGRRTGGKVRGMVASFERSASRSEDSDSDGEGGSYVRRSYGRRGRRSGSNGSDESAGSSSSSFSTASSGPFPPDVVERATKLKASVYKGSTSERHHGDAGKVNGISDEPTMEQLLACTPWDDLTSQLHGEAGIGDDAALDVETIKLRDAGVEPGAITDDSNALPIPHFSSSSLPGLSRVSVVEPTVKVDEGDNTELTVEQLLTLAELRGEYAGGVRDGADAWERVVGSTVKRVESDVRTPSKASRATIPVSNGRSRRGKGSLSFVAKKEAEGGRRLGDVFLAAGDDKKPDRVVKVARGPSPPPPSGSLPAPVGSARKLKLEQEMSETREMVRALSARVATVEARIGEMERVAGELEVRGKKLAEEGEERKRPRSGWRARWLASVTGACRSLRVFSLGATSSRPSWTRYLLFLGLGACAFLLREVVVRRGIMLKGRVILARG